MIEKNTLNKLRLKNGLSQEALSKMIGVTRKTIYKYENGTKVPDDKIKQQLCLIFHLELEELNTSIETTMNNANEKSLRYPCNISFRCTEEMYLKIRKKAEQANMPLGQYVRETYNGGELIVIDGLKEFSFELKKIGTNLNQLMKLCNMGVVTAPELKPTKKIMTEIYIKLNRILSQL